jgi:hypothetical protein
LQHFRVVDLRPEEAEAERFVEARTPEEAATSALGELCVRGTRKNRADLVCKVYWPVDGGTNMVRFYRRTESRAEP